MEARKAKHGWIWTTLFSVISVAWVFPIFLVVLNSFKKKVYISKKPFALPTGKMFVGLENYVNGINKTGLISAFGWSVFITVFSVAAIILFCSMTAWYITRVKSKVTSTIYYLCLFSMIVPFQMVMYTLSKIANMLNEKGYKTKRNCKWSQNATCRILTNEIYTGKIINGKQEVSDFLTGQRRDKDETEWMVVERPELRIIEDETFEKAQEILRGRHDAFNLSHERQSNKHLFSTLIKCKECGWSFRRTVRTYKNTYVRWVCSGRNGRGADSCPNKTVVDEEELIEVLQEYFTNVLKQKKKVIAHVVNEFQRVYKAKDENVEYEKELNAELAKLQKTRQKYMDMYTDDLISREELNEKIGGSRQEMERIENELKMVSYHLTKGEQLENILNNTFKEIEDITDVHQMTNQQLKRLIQKIEVDKEGNVDIYLRLLGDLGLDESVLIEENETALNCDDQT